MDYQLSHATKYATGVVLTTEVIIAPSAGVVKVLGENLPGRHFAAGCRAACPALPHDLHSFPLPFLQRQSHGERRALARGAVHAHAAAA